MFQEKIQDVHNQVQNTYQKVAEEVDDVTAARWDAEGLIDEMNDLDQETKEVLYEKAY